MLAFMIFIVVMMILQVVVLIWMLWDSRHTNFEIRDDERRADSKNNQNI